MHSHSWELIGPPTYWSISKIVTTWLVFCYARARSDSAAWAAKSWWEPTRTADYRLQAIKIDVPPELVLDDYISLLFIQQRYQTFYRRDRGNYNRLRRSIAGLGPLQDGPDVKSTCFGIFQKFWRGIALNYYWVSRTTFFKNCPQCPTKNGLVN